MGMVEKLEGLGMKEELLVWVLLYAAYSITGGFSGTAKDVRHDGTVCRGMEVPH